MKTTPSFLLLLCILSLQPILSQVRIGGGVSIDVNIDIPIPDVVVIGRTPKPPVVITEPRRERPVIHTPTHENYGYGEIQNQNGPYGRQIYQVVQASLEPTNKGIERVIYHLDTGDVLELYIATANPNDYNYHIYNHCDCQQNNRITEVLLNGQYLPLRDGALSLQPRADMFHSVLNLHSVHEGDFNGTVNF